MQEFVLTFLSVFAFVFIAELADKTQLFVFFLGSRYKKRDIFFGVMVSSAILMAIVVFPVKYIKEYLPIFYIKIASASLFVIFGIMGLFERSDESHIKVKTFRLPGVLMVFLSFFIAELGDRTQLAGISLAMKYKLPFAVWLGAWLGLFLANVPVIFGGHYIMKKIKPSLLKNIGALVFILFGIYIFIETFLF
jgi:putative Ca2+/H+ antiporter (TMEM165/GDT1 family)